MYNKEDAIIAGVLAIIGTLSGVYIGFYLTIEPDFGLSVDPPQIGINKLGSHNITIDLYNIHSSKKYQYQVILRLYNMDNFSLPSGVSYTYYPLMPISNPLEFNDRVKTDMNIRVDKRASNKEYPLRIVAIGSNGKQRVCPLMLVVP